MVVVVVDGRWWMVKPRISRFQPIDYRRLIRRRLLRAFRRSPVALLRSLQRSRRNVVLGLKEISSAGRAREQITILGGSQVEYYAVNNVAYRR